MTRRWVLARHPTGIPTLDTWRLETVEMADVGPEEIRVRNRWISVDPGARARLSGDSYVGAMQLGETMDGFAVGSVEESNNERFPVGSRVVSPWGWQEGFISDGRGLLAVRDEWLGGGVTEPALIGVLGVPGLTAWFGLRDIGLPEEGETVLISSAAGPVGATAGQLAKAAGATVVGLAGSAIKRAYLDEIGFDATVDRHTDDLGAAIVEACPDGVDVYWDNVGGATLDVAITHMNRRGRIVISGQVSEYNRDEPIGIRNVPAFIDRRLRMEGLVVLDRWREFPDAIGQMAGLIKSGHLTHRLEIVEGFESLPDAFIGLFDGRDVIGRRVVACD